MAVGNVGEQLAPYKESDTFLSRDAGFTWEEVHKDAHLFEFGDSGSILVMANDEGPTDHVMYSTDEGQSWREYKFSDEAMRVRAIVTVPEDTSRRFILMGYYPRAKDAAVSVHLDFTSLTHTRCKLDPDDPVNDDFELWSPSEEREEQCLFGRQVRPSLLVWCIYLLPYRRHCTTVADAKLSALSEISRKQKRKS